MKLTLEERFRRRLTKFGKKNRLCRFLAVLALTAGMTAFHVASYFGGNVKRLSMMAMTLLIFAVYSSFSFPIFSSGEPAGNGLNSISEEAKDIVLAEEVVVDLDEMLKEEDELMSNEGGMPEDGDYLETHGDYYELYSASDILEAAGDRQGSANRDREDAETAAGDTEFSRDDWRLVLVNKQYSIPEDYNVTLGAIKTLKGTQYCDERIIDDYLDMLRAALEDNVELEITSPYRTQDYQKMLFNRKIKAYMKKGLSYMEAYQLAGQAVNVPGNSEHQIGLALDIVTPSYHKLTEGFAETDAGKWLEENSYKYGFILRYPKGKEYITGVEYEPWHFRYVGVEAATVITQRGITLEEFWEEL